MAIDGIGELSGNAANRRITAHAARGVPEIRVEDST
jgi:hypothetical protein